METEAGHKADILIIDDEEPIRKVLTTHLTKEGYSVTQSCGGNPIFDLIQSRPFDLVICDIKMPDVEGPVILEYIKKNFDALPVIMLTGLTDVVVAIEVLKKGAFDYLMKPVKKEDLLVVIRKALLHRDLLIRNKELEAENKEYQQFLEHKVRDRTNELNIKAMELQKAYGQLKSMSIQFVNVLAETIEAKDLYTRGHCNRMRHLCVEMGRLIDIPPEELELLEYASLLHDLGKIGVNEAILNKNGALNDEEAAHVKTHPEIGEKILQSISMMEPVAKIVVAHHENFNGTGYPRNLKGEDIPLGARIISVADLFDAMHSDRPYRKGLPLEVVYKEMERVAGTQLDPKIVRIFIDNDVSAIVNK